MTGVLTHAMDTAPRREDMPLMLYCPEQGGWHVGVWHDGHWTDFASLSVALAPVRWMPLPPAPNLP